ncbi:hypothetical protein DPX16_7171 [Anabarilius grahami]|uniref:Uncharacterized protein n=1 Tax=Anabarilius grahami TaxID=495550 RepID=A0A3N0XMB0_ANAGA|nr:hypothetical protein DPX16_7171 [Anabarilius grahami]
MEYSDMFVLVAQESHDFCLFTKRFISVALACPYDDQTLKSWFWIGANYHRPVDLPDTSGLSWMEFIIRCLESVRPRSRAQPDPEPASSPRTAEYSCEPPADGELPPAATGQPDPETPRTEVTRAPDLELHLTSDQGCEPTTSADEGEMTTEREDWLIDFSEESSTTQTHPSCSSSSSDKDIIMDCVSFTDPLPTLTTTPCSASPPVPSLLDVICPVPSPGNPCDVEPQVTIPPAALRPEVPVASPPAADLVAPSQPVDLSAPPIYGSAGDPPTDGSSGLPRPAGSPLVIRPSSSATDLRDVGYTPSLHPFRYRRLLLPLRVASVLGRTDVTAALGISTSVGRHLYIAAVSQASDVAGVRQLSVCARESTCRVSIGRPPDAVSPLNIIWTPPSINSAVDCRIWGALGLCQRSSTINAARGSSSSLHHSIITPSTSRAPSGHPYDVSPRREDASCWRGKLMLHSPSCPGCY